MSDPLEPHQPPRRATVQTYVVIGLVGIVAVLSLTLGGVLLGFNTTLDNQTTTLERRSVAERAVNCYSEKQSEFSHGLVVLFEASVSRNEVEVQAALQTLEHISFDSCKVDPP